MSEYIPFNRPFLSGLELDYIKQAHQLGHLSGGGYFTHVCHEWIESHGMAVKALLTHSCTAALEMMAILLDIRSGDEVIMPSYTFVSTANAFVLRGAVPVFVDIREDTLNLDESLIERAITSKTKAICPVHYAGVSCEMDSILQIARDYNLAVIEDAAQGMSSFYKGKPLGSMGQLGAISFHETKNVISGEGGALLINDESMIERAEIIREKGTDRKQFFDGKVDSYTWRDIGSSFLPSEIVAAFLWAQLQKTEDITNQRLLAWNYYHECLEELQLRGFITRPSIPDDCIHNAHMYYLLLNSKTWRPDILEAFKEEKILSVFHYVPLHTSPAGRRFCKIVEDLSITEEMASRVIRLPLWPGITRPEQNRVIQTLIRFFNQRV